MLVMLNPFYITIKGANDEVQCPVYLRQHMNMLLVFILRAYRTYKVNVRPYNQRQFVRDLFLSIPSTLTIEKDK